MVKEASDMRNEAITKEAEVRKQRLGSRVKVEGSLTWLGIIERSRSLKLLFGPTTTFFRQLRVVLK
jgi:hypothetical protein